MHDALGRWQSLMDRCWRQVKVKLVRASMFHPDNARASLELLHVRGMPNDLRPTDRLNILNTMVINSSYSPLHGKHSCPHVQAGSEMCTRSSHALPLWGICHFV